MRASISKVLTMTSSGWRLVADDLCCITPDSHAPALAEALRRSGDWVDVVCGRDTVFVQFDLSQISPEHVLEKLGSFEFSSQEGADATAVFEIPACYHPAVAPDLVETCEQLGLSIDEFVDVHSSGHHEVAMLGFMPGFAYIDGLDPSLSVDRLDQPRLSVAAGSIGLAGSQTGIYPFEGPGGWRLIARTPLRLFDPSATPPALLHATQKVRFVPISLDEFEAVR